MFATDTNLDTVAADCALRSTGVVVQSLRVCRLLACSMHDAATVSYACLDLSTNTGCMERDSAKPHYNTCSALSLGEFNKSGNPRTPTCSLHITHAFCLLPSELNGLSIMTLDSCQYHHIATYHIHIWLPLLRGEQLLLKGSHVVLRFVMTGILLLDLDYICQTGTTFEPLDRAANSLRAEDTESWSQCQNSFWRPPASVRVHQDLPKRRTTRQHT